MKLFCFLIAFLCCSAEAQTTLVLRPTADSDTTGVGIMTVELAKDTTLVSKVLSGFPVTLSLQELKANDTVRIVFRHGMHENEWVGQLKSIMYLTENVSVVKQDSLHPEIRLIEEYILPSVAVKCTKTVKIITCPGYPSNHSAPTFYLTRFDRCGEYDMLRLTPGVVGMGQEPPTITR